MSIRSAIIQIAEDITNNGTDDHAHSLLKLRDLLRDITLDTHILHHAYSLIWKCDLIHVTVEELRKDFTCTHGQWYTSVGLARTLSTVCSALHPHIDTPTSSNNTVQYNRDEAIEYYDMLLPAATDSLLILANNIHEFEHSVPSSAHSSIHSAPSVYLDQFEAVIDSLIRLCSAHITCVHRTIYSPYLLHLLMTDSHTYSLSILTSVQELVKLDEQVINEHSLDMIQTVLDELIYKVGGADKEIALMSLKLLALISSSSCCVIDRISNKYRGLSNILYRWSKTSMDNTMKRFVSTLLERVKVSDEEYRLYRAASIIQAGWRGCMTRRNLKKAERGIRAFQRLYRKRKIERQRELLVRINSGLNSRDEEMNRLLTIREQHEQQITLLEQLPAPSVTKYFTEQRDRAAINIQSWWRGERDRKLTKTMRQQRVAEQSANVIQRAYRKHLKILSTVQTPLHYSSKLPVTNPSEEKSELTNMMEWFYYSRAQERENDQKSASLYTQVIHILVTTAYGYTISL